MTHWSDAPTDVEALAPAGPGAVWVGDLGDNLAERADVTITRVPVGRGDRTVQPTSYRLSYPGGARDAETLVRDPRTGRLYVASKDVFGGTLYAVPRHLSADRVNPLTRVGRVLPMATDGAFFPDGRHLVVRGYGSATVYAWPSLQPVASFDLPAQPPGRGDRGGGRRVGVPLLRGPAVGRCSGSRCRPPYDARWRRRRRPRRRPRRSSSPLHRPCRRPRRRSRSRPRTTDVWPWVLGGLVGLGAVVVLVRSLRPR